MRYRPRDFCERRDRKCIYAHIYSDVKCFTRTRQVVIQQGCFDIFLSLIKRQK